MSASSVARIIWYGASARSLIGGGLHARGRGDAEGEAGDGSAVRGGGPGAGGQGQRERTGLQALCAASRGDGGDVRVHGALRRPGGRRSTSRHRALQDTRAQDGGV